MIEQLSGGGGNVLGFKISGKLHDEDYKQFVPLVDRAIAEHGKTRILAQGFTGGLHGRQVPGLTEGNSKPPSSAEKTCAFSRSLCPLSSGGKDPGLRYHASADRSSTGACGSGAPRVSTTRPRIRKTGPGRSWKS